MKPEASSFDRVAKRMHSVHSALPAAVMAVVQRLETAGHESFLTGECLADLACDRPRDTWTLATAASPSEIAELFAHAVPTARNDAVWQLPTTSGPVDLLPHRNLGAILEMLPKRGLSIWAMAWSPIRNELIDPHGGAADLEYHRLRCIGSARDQLRATPRLALEVARLKGQLGDEPDPELLQAMQALGTRDIERCSTPTRKRLLTAILCSPHAGDAVTLLAQTGLETALGARMQPDTKRLLDVAPGDLAIRLTIWLRGARPGRVLRRHRFAPQLASRVIALLAAHPIESHFSARRRSALVRLARLAQADRDALFWLRGAELEAIEREPEAAAAPRQQLEALSAALTEHIASEAARSEAPLLRIDGRGVMEALGIDPGRWVGEALAFLKARVATSPEYNEPERLRALLQEWVRETRPALERNELDPPG